MRLLFLMNSPATCTQTHTSIHLLSFCNLPPCHSHAMLEWPQRSRKASSRPGIHNDWMPAVVILPVLRACQACEKRCWGSYKYSQDPHQLCDCGVQRMLSSIQKTTFSNSDNCVGAKYLANKTNGPFTPWNCIQYCYPHTS